MALSVKKWWNIFKDSLLKFMEDNSFRDSAAIAFYTIFSLPGMAILSVMIASGFFYEDEQVKGELLKQVSLLMGESATKYVDLILNAPFFTGDSLLMKSVSLTLLFFSATTVFISLQESLNQIWKVKQKSEKVFLRFLTNRILSLAFVASLGLVIIVSLTMDTLIAVFKGVFSDIFSGYSLYFIRALDFAFSEIIAVLIFAFIYKALPDVKIRWRDIWWGAIVTAILFTFGKSLISYYLSNGNYENFYGAAGSLAAMLAWIYYSMLILFFGAQLIFNNVKYSGRRILPSKHAVEIETVEVDENSNPY